MEAWMADAEGDDGGAGQWSASACGAEVEVANETIDSLTARIAELDTSS